MLGFVHPDNGLLSVALLSRFVTLCLLLCSGLSFCAQQTFAVRQPSVANSLRLILEAEDFDGLTSRSFHDLKAEGWYVREANCRGYGTVWGNGKVAAIHSTAKNKTMQKRLDKPLPAGNYRLTVRVAGTTMAEKLQRENILRVQVGDAFVDFRWLNVGRSFRWLPMKELNLVRPSDTIKVTAIQFGGGGLVHLNEAQAKSIWLDTIYITNDLTETEPPTPERERLIKFGTDKLPLPEKAKLLWHQQWDVSFAAEPVRLQSFDGRKNMFPNGSFELGMPNGWAATNVDYTFCYLFTDADLDESRPFHGRFCLKVPANANPFSRPFLLEKGGKVTLSLYLRSERPQTVSVVLRSVPEYKPLLKMDCAVKEKWQRFSVSGDVPAGFVDVRLENSETLWVDGIQLERGEISPFAPRTELEAGFSTGELGNVLLDDGKEQRLTLWLHNSSRQVRKAVVRYRIVNLWEQVVAEGKTQPIIVKPETTLRIPFTLPMKERGIFSLQWSVEGRPMPEGELVFVVLPPMPEGKVRHQLAANMDVLEHPYRLFARMGFRWQLYCKFYPTFPDRANPKEGEWQWFDEQVQMAQKFGLETLSCLWASQPRPFWADWTKIPGETMGINRNNQRYYSKDRPVYPDIGKWRDYVRTLVSHYSKWLRFWCVEDETELYFTPADFLPIFKAAWEAIKGVDKNLQVGTSMAPQYHEELLELLDGQVDFIGASSWGASYWEARKIRWLQERWVKPWFCIGVGLDGQPSFYHTFPNARPALKEAAMAAQEMVKLCVVQDAKIVGHYTGRIRNFGTHRTSDFPLIDYDGTPLPFGAVYASVVRLLANAVPAGEVRLGEVAAGDSSPVAFLFEQGGRIHAVTWSNSPSGLYGHNVLTPETAQAPVRTLTFRNLPKGALRFTDCFGNDWKFVERKGEIVNVQLNPMPLFIWNERLTRSDFERLLKQAIVSPNPVYGGIFVLPNRQNPDRLDLVIYGRWLGDKSKLPDSVEVGTSLGQLMTDNQWLLLERQSQISHWSGNEFSVRLPTLLDRSLLRHPLENAQLYAWLLKGSETVCGIFDTLWVAIAPKRSAKLDGDLSEWDWSPAWLDFSFSWARFGRWLEQVEEGGEHLKEFMSNTDFVDARAAFWCSWNAGELFIAAKIFDDQPIEGDTLTVSVSHQPDVPPSPIVQVKLQEGRGEMVGLSEWVVRKRQDGWDVEARVQKTASSWLLTSGKVIGFDLRYRDADIEGGKLVSATLRWAGAARSGCLWLVD
jgi:hypothetical protein